jgi:hypothetical protein
MGFPRYPRRSGHCARHYWIGYGNLRNEDCPKCKALKNCDRFPIKVRVWLDRETTPSPDTAPPA